MLTSKQINKIYEDRQRKVKELFKYLRKTSNIGLNSEGFLFCASHYDLYFNQTEQSFIIKSLNELDSLPTRKGESLPKNFTIRFTGLSTRNLLGIHSNMFFNGYIINKQYYMLYCETLTTPRYFNYFWLYDFKLYDALILGVTVKKGELGQLYSFDKAMELIEVAKNEWALEHL